MDNLYEDINYNAIPFKLRFTSRNKTYQKIQKLNDDLFVELEKINQETNDKMDISNLMKESFDYLGNVLKLGLNYLYSINCQLNEEIKVELQKLFEEKIICFGEDQQEHLNFEKIKPSIVSIQKLAPTWMCQLWKLNRKTPQPNHNPHNFQEYERNTEDSFDRYLKEIDKILTLLNRKIRSLKQNIDTLDEDIIWLFNNLREYMKFIINFEFKLYQIENCNEETDSLKNCIQSIFDIEKKVDFFSTSSKAYVLHAFNKKLSIELRHE